MSRKTLTPRQVHSRLRDPSCEGLGFWAAIDAVRFMPLADRLLARTALAVRERMGAPTPLAAHRIIGAAISLHHRNNGNNG